MATKQKKSKKKTAGSLSTDGLRPLTAKESKLMKKNKIGMSFKIKKGEKFIFKIGNKTVMTID